MKELKLLNERIAWLFRKKYLCQKYIYSCSISHKFMLVKRVSHDRAETLSLRMRRPTMWVLDQFQQKSACAVTEAG